MSATGRNLVGHERRSDDFYATPAWATRAILPHLHKGNALDPCCGEGAILDVIRDKWNVDTFGIEIDTQRALVSRGIGGHGVSAAADALGSDCWPMAETLVTNPPYSLAMRFIERWQIEETCPEAAFLLRLNFLGSLKRAEFHRKYPCDVYVLPRRPSFTNGGTDATEYAWMVWGSGRGNRWYMLDVDSAP